MTTIADSKRRIVLPAARPGDVFEILPEGEGQFRVVRLERPKPPKPMSKADCLAAMKAAPLRPRLSWSELRALTRDE